MDLDVWDAGATWPGAGSHSGRSAAGARSMAGCAPATIGNRQPHSTSLALVCIGRVKTMVTIRRGFLTGLFAGLVLAMLDVVVDGAPANGLQEVLRSEEHTF